MKVQTGFVTIVTLIMVQSPCPAQYSPTALALLKAEHAAGLGDWNDAIRQYQRILETSGNELVPVLPPLAAAAAIVGGPIYTVPWASQHSRQARWLIHRQIASWPAEGSAMYRQRVDDAAARKLEAAKAENDDFLFQQLLAEMFNSRAGEQALLTLAQRAWRRADIAEASRCWRMLLDDYPNQVTPRSLIEARWLMSRMFLGEQARVATLLPAFRERHGDAIGLLAGRKGHLGDTLTALLSSPRDTTLQPPPDDGQVWSTFGGKPTRNTHLEVGLPRDWPGMTHTWSAELPEANAPRRAEEPAIAPDQPRTLAHHPVIGHGRAFTAGSMRVDSYDLHTGTHRQVFDPGRTFSAANVDTRLPIRDDTRFTLTLHDRFLYARIGGRGLRTPRDNVKEPNESSTAIVALGPIADDLKAEIPHAWTLRPPPGPPDSFSMFEGAPVVADGRLYVVVWRQSGGNAVTLVGCYRLPERGRVPELAWLREVGTASAGIGTEARTRHNLLTLAGNLIVACTNAGTILAIDRETGLPAWEYRYRRVERKSPNPELCPGLFDGERLFAAPLDSDRVLCLDAFTGRKLWDRDGLEVVHLLGTARGRVIATTGGPIRGLHAFDVHTGAGVWSHHADGGLATFGRGIVSPGMVYWPTKQALQFLDPATGDPIRQPLPGLFGNLAYARGCFVVTDGTTIRGYVSEGPFVPLRLPVRIAPGTSPIVR